MKNNLNTYLDSTQRIIGGVFLASSILMICIIFAFQYHEKENEIKHQLSFLGSVTREDLLSGNGLEIYQTCKRFFESNEILSLKISNSSNEFCSLSRRSSTLFRISSTQNVLFNPSIPDSPTVAKIEVTSSSNALMTSSVTILLFVLIVLFLLLLSKRKIFKILKKDIVEPLEYLVTSLPQIKLNEPVKMLHNAHIEEIKVLNTALIEYSKNIQRAAKEDIKKAEYEALWKISRQVAHDIRSPLAALQMSLGFLENIPDCNKNIIEGATNRIYNIANTLLTKKSLTSTSYQTIFLPDYLNNLVEEKRMEHLNKNIFFKLDISLNNRAFIKADPTDLGRALSNIINNSVEALESNTHGVIHILLREFQSGFKLEVKDNGRGIPENILAVLGQEDVSYGKSHSQASGTGIGFSYAKEILTSLGGTIQVVSQIDKGTTVSISLPSFYPRIIKEFLLEKNKNINNQTKYDCVLVEDDNYIRLAWKERAKKAGISLLAVKDIATFQNSLSQLNKEVTTVFIDSELKDDVRGEELAAELYYLGFRKIFLASGFDQFDTNYTWLKNVGKTCPF